MDEVRLIKMTFNDDIGLINYKAVVLDRDEDILRYKVIDCSDSSHNDETYFANIGNFKIEPINITKLEMIIYGLT